MSAGEWKEEKSRPNAGCLWYRKGEYIEGGGEATAVVVVKSQKRWCCATRQLYYIRNTHDPIKLQPCAPPFSVIKSA